MEEIKYKIEDIQFKDNARFSIRYNKSGRWSNGKPDPRGREYGAAKWPTIQHLKAHLREVGKNAYADAEVVVWCVDIYSSSPRISEGSIFYNAAMTIPIIKGKQL